MASRRLTKCPLARLPAMRSMSFSAPEDGQLAAAGVVITASQSIQAVRVPSLMQGPAWT
jgi:hypothetical protein